MGDIYQKTFLWPMSINIFNHRNLFLNHCAKAQGSQHPTATRTNDERYQTLYVHAILFCKHFYWPVCVQWNETFICMYVCMYICSAAYDNKSCSSMSSCLLQLLVLNAFRQTKLCRTDRRQTFKQKYIQVFM